MLDKGNLVGKKLCQGQTEYESGGIFFGLFLAPKTKYCLTIKKFGILQQHVTFKSFNDSKRFLDRSQNFDMLKGKNISALLPRSWKKSFKSGIVIPAKLKRSNECKDKILHTTCNNQVKENKEFKANLNLMKRKAPNQLGHRLP